MVEESLTCPRCGETASESQADCRSPKGLVGVGARWGGGWESRSGSCEKGRGHLDERCGEQDDKVVLPDLASKNAGRAGDTLTLKMVLLCI